MFKKTNHRFLFFSFLFIGFFLSAFFNFSYDFFTVSVAHAQTANPEVFENPLPYDSFEAFLTALVNNFRAIVIILGIVFIVIGGVVYVVSVGNDGRITKAKTIIQMAALGVVIAVAAPLFLNEIAESVLGVTDTQIVGTGSPLDGAPKLLDVSIDVLNFLLGIFGVVSVLALVVGGLMYITATFDEGQIDQGKKIVQYAILGIVIALSALVVVRTVASFFATVSP